MASEQDKIVYSVEMDTSGYEKGLDQLTRADKRRAKKAKKGQDEYTKEQMAFAKNLIGSYTKTNNVLLQKQEVFTKEKIAGLKAGLFAEYKGAVAHQKKMIKVNYLGNEKAKKGELKQAKDLQKIIEKRDKWNYDQLIKEAKLEDKFRERELKEQKAQAKKEQDIIEKRDKWIYDQKVKEAKRLEAEAKKEAERIRRMSKETGMFKTGSFAEGATTGFSRRAGVIGASSLIFKSIRLIGDAFRGMIQEVVATDAAMAKLNTVLEVSDERLNSISDTMRNIARGSGKSFQEVMEGAYQAMSTNVVDEGQLEEFMKTSAQLAKGGFTTVEKSVDVLTSTLSAYNIKAEDAWKVSDQLIKTQKDGKIIVDQMNDAYSKFLPIASSLNVSFEDVNGAMIMLTNAGNSASRSATQLSRFLGELSNENSKLSVAIKEGSTKSFAELMEEGKTLADVMQILDDYMVKTGKSAGDLTGNINSQRFVLSTTGEKLDDYKESIKGLGAAYGETKKASDKAASDIGTSWQNLKTALGDLFWNEDIKNALKTLVDESTKAVDLINGKMEVSSEQTAYVKLSKVYGRRKGANDKTYLGLQESLKQYGVAGGKAYVEGIENGMTVAASEILAKNATLDMNEYRVSNSTSIKSGGTSSGGDGGGEEEASYSDKMDIFYLDQLRKQIKFEQATMGIKNLTDNEKALREAQFHSQMLQEKQEYMEKVDANEKDLLQNQLEALQAKQAIADAEMRIEEEKNKKRLTFAKVAEETTKDIARTAIRDGEMSLEKMGALALENIAMEASADGAISLSKAFTLAAQQRWKASGQAALAATKSFAIAGMAGGAAMSINDSLEEEDIEEYTDPEEVAEEVVEEQEPCTEFIVQGFEPFLDALREHSRNKYNYDLIATEIGKGRR